MDVREGTVRYAMRHRKPLWLLDTVMRYTRAGSEVEQFRVVAPSVVNENFFRMDLLFVLLAAMAGQDKEHTNTLRLEIPSDSVVIESVPRLNLIPEIFYSKYQYVPKTFSDIKISV